MTLTAIEVRNAKAGERPYKLADEKGLYLYVTAAGARSWRLNYRFAGKNLTITFGLFPEVSLAEAREQRDAARTLMRQGKNPAAERDRARRVAESAAASTFEPVARAWHAAELPRWSPGQQRLILRALERDVFPALGRTPAAEVTGPDILTALRKVEARGSIETAHRIRGYIDAIFERAIGEHLVEVNPAAKLAKALRRPAKGAKQPALLTAPALIGLQQSVDRSTSSVPVKLASRLLGLTVVRIGVLRAATWDEFSGIDWSKPDEPAPAAAWRIAAARMKLEVEEKGDAAYDHDVPLPPQAVELLRALRVVTGRCRFLFPSQRTTARPMSDSTLSPLYRRRGYQGRMVPHGWRAAFSTIMSERAVELEHDGDRLAIDLMLAHVPRGVSASEYAYNRARYAGRRRELATAWADLILPGLEPPMVLLGDHAR